MSLPSSPTVKTVQGFQSYEEELVRKPRSSSEKTKKEGREKSTASPSSSLGLPGRRTLLEGFKIKSRTKSGDNLSDRSEGGSSAVSQSDDRLNLSTTRRLSESVKQVSELSMDTSMDI